MILVLKNGDFVEIDCMQPVSEKNIILIFLEEKLIKENKIVFTF